MQVQKSIRGSGLVGGGSISLLFCFLFLCTGCLKKDFDQPPDTSGEDPDLLVTHTIAELKAVPRGVAIDEAMVISGIVVMNDKSGNYYQQIVLQDRTGGIAIKINQTALYNDYPVGRRVFVKCRGLFLGLDHQNPVLGSVPDQNGRLSPIPFLFIRKHLVKGSYPHTYRVDTLSISDLSTPNAAAQYLNTVVALKEVQFAAGSAGVPYAQSPDIAATTALFVEDCEGRYLRLVTSGYASFQSMHSSAGKGVLVALYTRYDNQARLSIRDTQDVRFYDSRCDGTALTPPTHIRIDSLRKCYRGHEVFLPPLSISGIVISDALNGNVTAGFVVLQGGNDDGGILLDYGSGPGLALGDSITVTVTGCRLHRSLSGALLLSGVRMDQTERLAVDRHITPKELTIATLLTHKNDYESTLVRLSSVHWVGMPATYFGIDGKIQLSDGTGMITHYCNMAASFKNLPVPAAPVQSLTGYFELHGLYGQIRIRYPNAPINDVLP